jgi:ADP-L-glycero-D-manno-heptose 6-epimerase
MILVTGGAGFIGSNIANALAARGEQVAVCDRFDDGDKWRNLAKCELWDIVPPEAMSTWLDAHASDVTAIVHMGAITATTERDVDLILANNLTVSMLAWRWCAQHGRQLVYASSAATYGAGDRTFDDDASSEALARLRPLNPYGWSKLLFDRWVARQIASGAARPTQCAGLRFFNVYGPNEYHKGTMQSVVAQKYAPAARGEPLTLFRSHIPDCADGEQKRDFVYVRDCVDVVLWMLDHPQVEGLYNLGSGRARSFADLAHALARAAGRIAQIEFIDMPLAIRDQYQYFTQASMARLRDAGYTRAMTPLEEGVHDYVGRYLSQPDRYL